MRDLHCLEAPRFERSFEPVFESASQARSFAREAAEALGRGDAADRVEMLVGELAANAILHAQTSYTVALNLTQGDLVRVEVWDGNPDLPRRKPAIGDDVLIHGRGMALIEALADRWGVVGREEGKCVWSNWDPRPRQSLSPSSRRGTFSP